MCAAFSLAVFDLQASRKVMCECASGSLHLKENAGV